MAYNTVDDLPKHLRAQAEAQLAPPASSPRGPVGANPKSPRKTKAVAPPAPAPASAEAEVDLFPSAGTPKAGGRGQHIAGCMNNLEKKYSLLLNQRLAAGEIVWWSFESVKFRLGPNCYYTPDFFLQLADGMIEIHETKGFMEEDSRVKLSVMKGMYPFMIWLAYFDRPNKKTGDLGGWRIVPA